jgi:hypothetical protein
MIRQLAGVTLVSLVLVMIAIAALLVIGHLITTGAAGAWDWYSRGYWPAVGRLVTGTAATP